MMSLLRWQIGTTIGLFLVSMYKPFSFNAFTISFLASKRFIPWEKKRHKSVNKISPRLIIKDLVLISSAWLRLYDFTFLSILFFSSFNSSVIWARFTNLWLGHTLSLLEQIVSKACSEIFSCKHSNLCNSWLIDKIGWLIGMSDSLIDKIGWLIFVENLLTMLVH